MKFTQVGSKNTYNRDFHQFWYILNTCNILLGLDYRVKVDSVYIWVLSNLFSFEAKCSLKVLGSRVICLGHRFLSLRHSGLPKCLARQKIERESFSTLLSLRGYRSWRARDVCKHEECCILSKDNHGDK